MPKTHIAFFIDEKDAGLIEIRIADPELKLFQISREHFAFIVLHANEMLEGKREFVALPTVEFESKPNAR